MMPRKAPAAVRSALRQTLATARLAAAAQAVLEAETKVAARSYAVAGKPFTDEDWRREDARDFRLYRELKSALKELQRAQGAT